MARKAMAKADNTIPTFVVEDKPDWVGTGRGNEDVTSDDVTIPRLDILQALSPQVDENDSKFIEGAKQGMFFNTATNELYGQAVIFIPVYFRKEWVCWKDLQKGGGFRGAYASEAEAIHAMQTMDDAPDVEIVDTAQQFGLLVHQDGGVEEIVLSCSRTKMKPSRKLNTLSKMAGGDRFSSVYELKVIQAENAANQKFWNFDVKRLGWLPKELVERGERFYEAVATGARDVDRRHEATGSESVAPEDLDA